MTTLSWLLYFAEISTNIGIFCGFMMFFSAIIGSILSIIIMVNHSRDMTDTFNVNAPKIRNISVAVFFFSMVGLLFPSQNTVYLIIASESANTVVTSETGQKMIGDIQNIVSLKLDDIAKEITGTTITK